MNSGETRPSHQRSTEEASSTTPQTSEKLQNSTINAGTALRRLRVERWSFPEGWLLILGVLLLLASPPAIAQRLLLPQYIEPKPFDFHLTQISSGVYAEGVHDETTYKDNGVSVTHDHYFVGPSIGLNAFGSIYHPNLLTYHINSEGAYGWGEDSFSGSSSSSRNEWQYLGRFDASADLLDNKPYHATAFGSYDHSYRNNDFFSEVTVDSWRYGARSVWNVGSWAFNTDYTHHDEHTVNPYRIVQTTTNTSNGVTTTNQTTVDQTMDSHDDVINFNARQDRGRGGTTLNYSWDQYSRVDAGQAGNGADHSISVADNERFGADDRAKWYSTATYLRREANTEPSSDEVTASSTLNYEHNHNLNSFYDLEYDYFDQGDFNSSSYFGQASVTHQLYESLTSSLIGRGSDYESTAGNTSASNDRYGGGISEQYTKRLSDTARLVIGTATFVDHTDNNSDNFATVRNERHTFAENNPVPNSFTLNRANVNASTIVITDDRGTQPPYQLGFDYTVSQNGSRTIIQRPFGSSIPPAATVLVSYQAQPTPSGSYETLSESFQIRFELWNNLVGFYGRINASLNNAPENMQVQNIVSYTLGSDLTYRWFRAGTEYVIYNSTDSDYTSARAYQSAAFHPDGFSSLNLDLTEAWIDYRSAHREETDLIFITRYHRSLSQHFSVDTSAGVAWRNGQGVDQTLATFRTAIKYVIGRTSLNAGYDYQYNLFLNNQEQQTHRFFVGYKRYF
jgi:hypothetical protein